MSDIVKQISKRKFYRLMKSPSSWNAKTTIFNLLTWEFEPVYLSYTSEGFLYTMERCKTINAEFCCKRYDLDRVKEVGTKRIIIK